MKILYIGHGHPDLSPGGGERAAYSIFKAAKTLPGVETFFASPMGGNSAGKDGEVFAFRERRDEALVGFPHIDHFNYMSSSPRKLAKCFSELFSVFAPDVIHFHHFTNIGIEAFEIVKRLLPDVKVVLTLHEYLLLCDNFGQMLRLNGMRCETRVAADCAAFCKPDRSPGDFFLRSRYIEQALSHVDAFHAPSQFLIDLFERNGVALPGARMIENIQPFGALKMPPPRLSGTAPRVGFFGQLNRFKGIDVLMRAVETMRRVNRDVEFHVFGSLNKEFDPDFYERVMNFFEENRRNCVFRGRYDGKRSVELMSTMDISVVPSTWYENSPLVIQEAIAAGIWIVGSDIGGTAEKVSAYERGRLFRVGDAYDLVFQIQQIVENELPNFQHIPVPDETDARLRQYEQLYLEQLSAGERGVVQPSPPSLGAGSPKTEEVQV